MVLSRCKVTSAPMLLSRCKVPMCTSYSYLYPFFFADGVNCWISKNIVHVPSCLEARSISSPSHAKHDVSWRFPGNHSLCVLGEMPAGNTCLTLYHEQDNCVVMTHDNPPPFEGDNITLKETLAITATPTQPVSLSKSNGQRCLYKFYLKFR